VETPFCLTPHFSILSPPCLPPRLPLCSSQYKSLFTAPGLLHPPIRTNHHPKTWGKIHRSATHICIDHESPIHGLQTMHFDLIVWRSTIIYPAIPRLFASAVASHYFRCSFQCRFSSTSSVNSQAGTAMAGTRSLRTTLRISLVSRTTPARRLPAQGVCPQHVRVYLPSTSNLKHIPRYRYAT